MFRRPTRTDERELTAQGAELLDKDRRAAERCYRAAVQQDPDLKEAWFDLGLICKWEHRWEEAFECNRRAAELEGPRPDEPAWWNLGIAATALRRWEVARRAWETYGIPIPPGVGPIEGDFGVGPVRLNPTEHAEVVWGHRIDPARIRLTNIPFPASGHQWADVVLHDGAPNGYREVQGRQVGVFDELERWEPSGVPTIQVSVSSDEPAAIGELTQEAAQAGYAAEDWTRNVRMLCKRCSEGSVHAEHDESAVASGRAHLLGFAGPLTFVSQLVTEWANQPGRICHGIDQVL